MTGLAKRLAGRRKTAKRHSAAVWSRGGLTPKEIVYRLWVRSRAHRIWDQAAALSFYFLVALFPLLLLLSTLIGLVLSSQSAAYLNFLEYLNRIMPTSAVKVFSGLLDQLTAGASGSKLSFGVLVTLWAASSGVTASIEALNTAFEVPVSRSWWHRRIVAVALTIGIGLTIAASLVLLLAGTTVAAAIMAELPILSALSQLSNPVRRLVGLSLLWVSLNLIYGFGPNLNRKRWEGILPGACFALACWLIASFGLRFYLSSFGSLNHYGSLAGVIALLFWIYLSAAALLLGGELNAIIWHATGDRPEVPV